MSSRFWLVFWRHVVVIFGSILFSFLLYDFSYAEDVEPFPESTLNEDGTVSYESQSDQSDSLSNPENQSLDSLYVQNLVVLPSEEEEEPEEEIYVLSAPSFGDALPDSSTLPDSDTYIYVGSFNGETVYMVFPGDVTSKLAFSGDVLINVSSSTIYGRLFRSASFDLSSYEYDVITLLPVLTSASASAVHSYNYPSYLRHYYENNYGNLVYSDTYGPFEVSEQLPTVLTSPDSVTSNYVLFILLFVGIFFILRFIGFGRSVR